MSNERITTSDKILRKGSPIIKKLLITNWNLNESYDLSAVFTQLNIYSSIDGIIASGDITISEQGNLISVCPLEGREFIEIEFCSTDKDDYESYHRLFFVYAVDDISESKDTRSYIIRFTDVLGVINPDIRLSIKYEDKLENIIKKIEEMIENPEMGFEEYKQILNVNNKTPTGNLLFPFTTKDDLSIETEYPMKFVVPQWHPIKFITYLTDRALSKDSVSLQEDKFTDCVFFQNRKGEFVLTNYKKMFTTPLSTQKTKNIVFKREIANTDAQSTPIEATTGAMETKYAVQKFDLLKIFNTQIQKQVGMYGFTDYITDFVNAKCEPKDVKAEEITSCLIRYGLSLGEPYPYETIKKTENGVFYYDTCGINMSVKDMEYERFTLPYLKGKVLRVYMEYAKIVIEMNGVSDIDIGKYVYIDLGRADDNSVTQFVNGTKWVVSKYAHRFLADGTFTTVVECFTPYINREKDANHTQAERLVQSGNEDAISAQQTMMF